MFEFTVTDSFIKSLQKLEPKVQAAVKKKLKFLSGVEQALVFAKKLKGKKDIFRFRSGDYRIVFRLEGREVVLLLVKHRKDIYFEDF